MSRGIRSPERLSHPCLCVDGQPRSFAHLARARRVAGPPDESAGATLCPVRESPESPQRQFMGRPLPFLPDSGRRLAADLPTLYRTEPGARRHGGASWGIPLVELSRQYRRRSLPAHHPASHPHYETLGTDEATRQTAYRQLFQEMLGADLLNENRRASNGNFVMDNARFAAEIVAALNRRVIPGKPRRPRKTPQGLSGDLFDDKE